MKTERTAVRSTAANASAEKILLVIGDAAEVTDTLYPWMRIQEAGYQVVVAAPEVRVYSLVQHERPAGWDITRETAGYQMQSDIAFEDIQPAQYAGLLVSGGRAPEYIRYDKDLQRCIHQIADAGKPIAYICHGIEILTAADCIAGKRVTTVAKCAMDAEQGGATYVDQDVVIDGQLVTGRGYAENTIVLREFISMLKTFREKPELP